MNLEKELVCAREAAIQAGEKVLEIYNRGFSIEYKEDTSPLTEADKQSDAIIREQLNNAFPEYAILSEEFKEDHSRFNNDWCFVIDPLDGTKEFIKRTGEFTINIALAYKHEVVMGVIYIPVTKELYYAAKGTGAYHVVRDEHNVSLTKLSVTDKVEDLIIVGSKSHASEKLTKLIENNKDRISELKSAGSSLKGCMVAKGEADIYYRYGYTCEWDTAAMQCIVEEAGGIFRQMDHSLMTYNRENNLNEKGFYIVNREENIFE